MITKESKLNVFRLTVLDEKNKKKKEDETLLIKRIIRE